MVKQILDADGQSSSHKGDIAVIANILQERRGQCPQMFYIDGLQSQRGPARLASLIFQLIQDDSFAHAPRTADEHGSTWDPGPSSKAI